MSRRKIAKYGLHFAGVIAFSMIACLIELVSEGIALSPIINRSDDAPRTEAAFTGFERFCGFINEGMLLPFSWIPAGALNDTAANILFAISWGVILYIFFLSAIWVMRRLTSRRMEFKL